MVSEVDTINGYGSDITVGVEKRVGTIRIGGTTYNRYVKIIDVGTLPSSATYKSVTFGETYVGVLSLYGSTSNATSAMSIPHTSATSTDVIYVYINGNGPSSTVAVGVGRDRSSFTNTYITVEYYR